MLTGESLQAANLKSSKGVKYTNEVLIKVIEVGAGRRRYIKIGVEIGTD